MNFCLTILKGDVDCLSKETYSREKLRNMRKSVRLLGQ
jgi:hypothetical protein